MSMKKILITALLILASAPCFAAKDEVPEVKLQSIFLTDTSDAEDYIEPENIPLKGYAEYIEDAEAVYLKDDNNQFVLNIKVPQKITSSSLIESKDGIYSSKPALYSRHGSEEYQIKPKDASSIVQNGKLSFGTNMEQDVSYGELEHTAKFFTRYDKGRFGFVTAYKRTIGSTYNKYYDSLYVAPEFKLNKFLSVKEVLTADMTYDRKKAEFVLSVNPLANTQDDRLNLELGASQTYDNTNSLIRKKIEFNTRFKL